MLSPEADVVALMKYTTLSLCWGTYFLMQWGILHRSHCNSEFKKPALFYLGKNVIGITIACDVTAADLWSATNSMMHKKERIIRMAELYMRQFGWSVGHPTYMEKFCSCERL